ncbi:MAG: hypothetical protein ACTSQN_07700 [Candidatus Heimdallarchaeota archaeon]
MTEKISLEQKYANLEKTTEAILNLDDSFKLPNGWDRRDLILHLWSWDDEMTKLCAEKLEGKCAEFKFGYEELGIDFNEWNDQALEKKKDLAYEEVKELFTTTRKKLLALYKKLMPLPKNEELDEKSFKRLANIMTLWKHDKTHLEKGGITLDI